MFVVPSSIDLASFDIEYRNKSGKEFLLRKVVSDIKGFDFVLIDCPPALGLLTINALAAADEVYIPIQTEYLALQGLGQLFDTLKAVTKSVNTSLKIGGLIGTRYNRRKINKDVMKYLSENFGEKTFKTVIRESVALAEAPSFGRDIYAHNPDSTGAQDYYALCKEIIS